MNSDQNNIYLSYSPQDRPWVAQFVKALEEVGLHARYSMPDIIPGEPWQEKDQQALRNSRFLVLILSPNSIGSPWTFFEIGAAIADDKQIIPVLTQEMDIKEIPFIRNLQSFKGSSPSEMGKRVAEAIVQLESQERALASSLMKH